MSSFSATSASASATARTCGMASADGVDRGRADVADDHLGPGLDEVADEAVPDLAHALDADGPALQAGAAPGVLGRRSHAVHDADGGQHGRVARAAVGGRPARRPAAFPGDDVHVLAARADVARGDVAPAEGGDEAAVGAQQRFGLDLGRVADDDRLAAAVVQAGQRVLVRHGGGQPQHVGEGLVLAAVRVEAGPAQRGAQRGGVDADDRLEPGVVVLAEDDLLVPAARTGPARLAVFPGRRRSRVGYREHVGHGGDSSHPVPVPR